MKGVMIFPLSHG